MTKNSVTYLIAIAALALGGEKILSLGRQNADLQSQNQDLQGQVSNLRAQLLKDHMKDQTEYFAARTAVEQLEAQVKAQKEVVATAEQRLRSEKNGGTGGKQLPALRDKIAQQKQVIADLEQRLHDLHSQEGGLRDQDHYYQQQAGQTQADADNELKNQIAQEQQTLRQMMDQARMYQQSRLVNPDYGHRYAEMQAKIAVERNTIQQLRDQRAAVAAQWGYEKNASHSQNQQDQSSLRASERDLQDQLSREKATLQTMNQDIQSGVQSQKSLDAQVQAAQADFDNQKAKLGDLQKQLQQAQNHLAELPPPGSETGGAEGTASGATSGANPGNP